MITDYNLYKTLSHEAGIADGKITNEFMFTLHVANIFLFENNIGASDIQEGFVDGKGDGGIDFIFPSDESMTIIQGKSSSRIDREYIINAVDKILRTIIDFEKNNYDKYSKRLKSAYLNARDFANDDSQIRIIFSTNDSISSYERESLEEHFKEDSYSNLDIVLYDKEDIEEQALFLNMEREFVPEDKLILSEPGNKLSFQDKGYIVNVKASSIKNIYTKHTRKGLFSYNLREHIVNKSVDSGISNTIKNEPDNFWFYNNGITIACSDCVFDGYVCKLYDFSIINGAQTTTKIGESSIINSNNDFDVICKIVKGGSLSSSDRFISNISQASNSQKPIIPRDLKSNAREQRLLQEKAANNARPLAIQIKRGVKPRNSNKVEKWQRVTNEDLGQLILCCILQRPGTARSGKRRIFEMPSLYKQVFIQKTDFDTLYDLVRLASFYDDFKTKYCKAESEKQKPDIDIISSCRNAKFVVIALISCIIKRKRSEITDFFDNRITQYNLSGTLISSYSDDDFEERLFEVFKYLISELKNLYMLKENELQLTSFSNFFKTDKTYHTTILSHFERVFFEDEFNKERLEKYVQIFDI